MMRQAIVFNGTFFNTQRMVWQYLHNAYHLPQAVAQRLLTSGI
jgi:hypothetical protein